MIFWTVRYTNTQIQIHKYTNTNTQIHKYTNTAYDKMTEIPNICYIFEKPRVQGYQKGYSGLTNTQIQIHKYANTAHHKVPEIPNICNIFEKPRLQGHQKMIFWTVKYTNTNS